MQTTELGRTKIHVSRLALGAGPVSGLMTGDDEELQVATLRRAIEAGINWIDTAAGYGNGQSEASLGRALKRLAEMDALAQVHIATKVRIERTSNVDFRSQVMRSVEASLERLGRPQVTLLQLHNGVTLAGDDEPASLSVAEVIGRRGAADALQYVQTCGLVKHIGLTGTGSPVSLRQVIHSGLFDTIQLPFNCLNPSAGQDMPEDFADRNYGNILADCQQFEMGAFAIRVMAGGALLGAPPSAHTLKTPYFPLDLYERDAAQANQLGDFAEASIEERAKRAIAFALAHPAIHSAIIGFGSPEHVASVL